MAFGVSGAEEPPMTAVTSVRAWLLWGVAAGFAVIVTRNPLYLSLAFVSIVAVYLSLDRRSALGIAWGTILRIGAVIALISVLFNVLTVHVGDLVFARLPAAIPVFGGPLTVNAALYGVVSGMALINLLLVAATFSNAVDRASIVALVPRRLGSTGLAAVTALSIFPETLRAIGQVREAQIARGFQFRSVRDLRALAVPVLSLGLEHAFNLAESMESRGFGRGRPRASYAWLAGALLIAALVAVVAFATGQVAIGLAAGALALMLSLIALWSGDTGIHVDSDDRWSTRSSIVAASALISIGLIGLDLFDTPSTLAFSPYPRMSWPGFAMITGLGYLLLLTPALIGREGQQSAPEHDDAPR
jgi:energy-coupling factor transport system permease protein